MFKENYSDIIIADLYSKHKIGGEDALRDDIKQLLEEYPQDGTLLMTIASGLMWMGAYKREKEILDYMLSKRLQMTMPVQQRLNALSKGGGKSVDTFDVSSTSKSLYFDVSALVWKDNEYIGLFDKLTFQGKSLSYSLAVRDEDKELNIPNGITVPKAEDIQEKLGAVFAEEYGDDATTRLVDGIAVSGSGEEKMQGILAVSSDCPQMGVLMHIVKIGRKLSVKHCTLFMPTNTDLSTQKQQALSLYKKLGHQTSNWESSLKETMLVTVQQLLNETAQFGNGNSGNCTDTPPIF